MKTIAEVIQLSAQFLSSRNVERAKRLSEELLASVLNVKRLDLYMQFDRPVTEKELAQMREPLKRCAKGEPLEYVLGVVEFAGCKISVDSRVLIPRPETEIMVEKIKKKLKGKVVWDLCTGSGCIGIALKKALDVKVTLSDISEDALAVARKNAEGLDIEILQGDLLAPFVGRMADAVVCNPPYITSAEYLELAPSVRDFEPTGALVGGTAFYERLAKELPDYLNPGGQVFLEIGAAQGPAVKEIFSRGPWALLELEKDWAGHDRFFFLEKQ